MKYVSVVKSMNQIILQIKLRVEQIRNTAKYLVKVNFHKSG